MLLPVFGTGHATPLSDAIPFASTSLTFDFSSVDEAIISSTPDGKGPIVIDNFMTINGENICTTLTRCFGPVIRHDLPTGVPIKTVLTPIPALNVSSLIPVGTTTVTFELRDIGGIAGNSDLFLVTTGQRVSSPIDQDVSFSDITMSFHGLLLDEEMKEIKLNKETIERLQDSMIESLTAAIPEEDEFAASAKTVKLLDSTGVITAIKLSDSNLSFSTGPSTSITEAISYASTSVMLDFIAGDTAVISSTPDGTGPIVIDNFLTINGENVCDNVEGQFFPLNCFGPVINPTVPTGILIQNVLTPIPPIDVSSFIPVGITTVLFELRDYGFIAGNSDLFLVTTGQRVKLSPLDKAFVEDVLSGFDFTSDERMLTKSTLIQKGIDSAPNGEKSEYQMRFDLINEKLITFIPTDIKQYRSPFRGFLDRFSLAIERLISNFLKDPARYISSCKAADVPIPPDFPTGSGWVNRGDLSLNNRIFGGDGVVWTYEAPNKQGLCYALPAKTSTGLNGIICQSKSTGKACFWQNMDAKTGKRILGTLRFAELMNGQNLKENCTNCHRGENAFLIPFPEDKDNPLGKPSLSIRNPKVRYTPVAPGRPDWVNPPAFVTKGSAGACSTCHEIPALNSNICMILQFTAQKSMPNTENTAGWLPSETKGSVFVMDIAHIRDGCKAALGQLKQ